MDLVEVLFEAEYFFESKKEARITLKKKFRKEFVCKVIETFPDPEGWEGIILRLERSENTTDFPTKESLFEVPALEIKNIEDF